MSRDLRLEDSAISLREMAKALHLAEYRVNEMYRIVRDEGSAVIDELIEDYAEAVQAIHAVRSDLDSVRGWIDEALAGRAKNAERQH